MSSQNLALLYTTFKDNEQAEKLTKVLLEKKLIACANFFDIKSLYRWEGEIASQNEVGCLLKTSSSQSDALKTYLLTHHPYDVPCLINLHHSNFNPAFLSWVVAETQD